MASVLPGTSTLILCDSHVHFYECFDTDFFLESAWRNFSRQVSLIQKQQKYLPVLLLSEAKNDNWFTKLKNAEYSTENWTFNGTGEPESLYAIAGDGRRILIISGRQIVTSENLEVLALATAEKIEDGKPIKQVIEWVKNNRAIPVIPWGFGKWWGKRGRILSGILDVFSSKELLLGDNSGRPRFLGTPGHFKKARGEQRNILPGSDPLPFASEAWRPGCVGFYFYGELDEVTPAACLRGYIYDDKTNVTGYMQCERLLTFVKNQVAMQLRKRM